MDNYPELILRFFTAQGIPDNNFYATMISDGTGSVGHFKKVFAEDGTYNAKSEFEAMVAARKNIKAAAKAGRTDYLDGTDIEIPHRSENEASILAKYPLVIATLEDNVEWWCSRDLFTSNTASDFIKGVVTAANIRYFGINDMLSILSADDQAALKALFHFDGEMFQSAYDNDKKVLVILGTSYTSEQNLSAYIKALQKLYGEDYVIYYKGHPGWPTGLYPEKLEMFEELGVTDIDSSIPAELILFYCPDIYLVGYQSTTFKSVLEDKLLGLFNQTKASGSSVAETNGYGDLPQAYFSVVTVSDKTYILIEYEDGSAAYYDVKNDVLLNDLP